MDLPTRFQHQLQLDNDRAPRVKIGIDFGTTFTSGTVSSLEYSTPHLHANEIHTLQRYQGVPGSMKNRANTEIPSCVRYYKGSISVGHDAEKKNDHNWSSGAEMIRRMKLGLDEQLEFRKGRDTLLKSLPSGMPPDSVTQDFFTEVFRSWKEEIKELGFPDEAVIELNCAVPAAWTTPKPVHRLSNAIMAAADSVDLTYDKAIRFWPEPIAAAAYMLQDNSNFRRSLQIGKIVIVCDAGGGTTDVSVLLTSALEPAPELQEIVPTRGVPVGSESLDEEFESSLRTRVSDFNVRERDIRSALKEFHMEFKTVFDGSQDYYTVEMDDLPADCERDFEEGFLKIRRKHMLEIFCPVLEQIWELLLQQLTEASLTGHSMQYVEVVLVGGFGGSKLLRTFLREKLASNEIRRVMGDTISAIELVIAITARDYAVAQGSIYCSSKDCQKIRRVNRCSIGVLQQEGWTKERPGHPREKPEPDPLTKEYLVDDCLLFLLKKDAPLIDPEPIELFKSFHPDEEIVEIQVPLYCVENNVEDHYPKDHPKNKGYREWERITFQVDVSSFKDSLETYSEENPQEGFPRPKLPRNRNHETNANDLRRRSQRTRKPTGRVIYTEALGSCRRTRSGKSKSFLPSPRHNPGPPSEPSSDQDSKSGEVEILSVAVANNERERLGWKTLRYLFHMEVGDGLVARYTLECLSAPAGTEKTIGTVSLTWMHETGTC